MYVIAMNTSTGALKILKWETYEVLEKLDTQAKYKIVGHIFSTYKDAHWVLRELMDGNRYQDKLPKPETPLKSFTPIPAQRYATADRGGGGRAIEEVMILNAGAKDPKELFAEVYEALDKIFREDGWDILMHAYKRPETTENLGLDILGHYRICRTYYSTEMSDLALTSTGIKILRHEELYGENGVITLRRKALKKTPEE